MTPAKLSELVKYKLRQETSTLDDAEILAYANTYIEDIAGEIQAARPGIFHVPAYFNLKANHREYGLPTDNLNSIVSFAAKLTPEGKYVPFTGLKEKPSDLVVENEEDVLADFSSSPSYFIRRKALYLLSGTIIDVEDGGLITYNAFPQPLADLNGVDDMSIDPSSIEHGFPREFHNLLATRICIAYKDKEELPLNREEAAYQVDLDAKLSKFSAPADESMEEYRDMPVDSTNNGFDL